VSTRTRGAALDALPGLFPDIFPGSSAAASDVLALTPVARD